MRHQVASRLAAVDLTLSPRPQDWAVAAVALHPASTLKEATTALGDVQVLQALTAQEREKLAQALVGLYPDDSGEQVWTAPRPDRLTATHLITLADQAASQQEWLINLTAVAGTDRFENAMQAATVLYRCLSASGSQRGKARIQAALEQLIVDYPAGYVPALTLIAPKEFTNVIITAIGDERYDINALNQFDVLLVDMRPDFTSTPIAVAVARRLEAATRPGPDATEEQRAEHAAELRILFDRLHVNGEIEKALATCQKAVAAYRELVQANSSAYLSDLANTLCSLSVYLSEGGRH